MERSRTNRFVRTVCTLVLWFCATGQGGIIYVDENAPAAGDGSSWSRAFVTLRDAMAVAIEGDEIRVAQGLYLPTDDPLDREASFVLPPGMIVRGGYAGLTTADADAWDPNTFVTVLSGDIDRNDSDDDPNSRNGNSYHVFTCAGRDNQALLEGSVVTGGNADKVCSHCYGDGQGGGLVCQAGCSPRVTDCVFIDNQARAGGAVCLLHTDGSGSDEPYEGDQWQPVFTRCVFFDNRAISGGGVSNGRRWRPRFVRCLWEGNAAERHGGAVESRIKADLTLTHCIFRRNDTGGTGGALSAHNIGRIELTNCLLVANTAADTGGAIAYPDTNYVNEPQIHRLLNCTFYGNTSPTLYRPPSRSVQEPDGSWRRVVATTITNCIIYGSVGDPISLVPSLAGPDFITSMYEPGPDPHFLDPLGVDGVLGTEDDDFHLAGDSPAIDAGTNETDPPLPTLDLDGNPRIINDEVDLGAYEAVSAVSTNGIGPRR